MNWLMPVPYWLAGAALVLVLIRQWQVKKHYRTAPLLERRRSAYMALVATLLADVLWWGTATTGRGWFGNEQLWLDMASPAAIVVVKLTMAAAAWILFWFYYIDRMPPRNDA